MKFGVIHDLLPDYVIASSGNSDKTGSPDKSVH